MGLHLKILPVVAMRAGLGDTDAALRAMAHHWVYTAQTWLSRPLEKDRLIITGLQVHSLAILAHQVLSISADLVWRCVGQLLHSSMRLGLYRDPKHFPSISLIQRDLCRRPCVTILELAVQSSMGAAMSLRMSLDVFDTEAPSNANDDEIGESTVEIVFHPWATYTATSAQLTLLDSLLVRLRIIQLLNSLRA